MLVSNKKHFLKKCVVKLNSQKKLQLIWLVPFGFFAGGTLVLLIKSFTVAASIVSQSDFFLRALIDFIFAGVFGAAVAFVFGLIAGIPVFRNAKGPR